MAVSRDYLQETVAESIRTDPEFKSISGGAAWLKEGLGVAMESVLKRHKARSGFAVLAGVLRPVWVLPQSEIKLAKGKTLRAQTVEVVDHI